jgi:hypothetical protein
MSRARPINSDTSADPPNNAVMSEVTLKTPATVVFSAAIDTPVAVEYDKDRQHLPIAELYLVVNAVNPADRRYRVVFYEYEHPQMEKRVVLRSRVPRKIRLFHSGALERKTRVTAEHTADEVRQTFSACFIAYFDQHHPRKLGPSEGAWANGIYASEPLKE